MTSPAGAVVTACFAWLQPDRSRLGVAHRLPLADSMVYATAQTFGGIVWTQDEDFEGLPGVRYFPKKKTGNT